jgi:hypothetical protein
MGFGYEHGYGISGESIKSSLTERELTHIPEEEIEAQSEKAHNEGLTQYSQVELAGEKRGNDSHDDE